MFDITITDLPAGTLEGFEGNSNYPIPRDLAYKNIVEWLYVNDGKYPNKNVWREKLLEVLIFNLLGNEQKEK